jgi:cholesterol transport system auxiliary component
MFKIKILSTLAVLFVLGGCVSSNYYVLSTAPQPTTTYKHIDGSIGVEKVMVPKYLFKREIAVAKSSSQVIFLGNASWAEDIDEGLTQRLISFLQKKFNKPEVYNYPWDMSEQPRVKVKIQISRFIAQGDRVYLDASIQLENMHTGKRKARLFATSVPTGRGASSIVAAMDKAFDQLEEQVAAAIRSF